MKINSYKQEQYKNINEKLNIDDIKNISVKKEQKNMNYITKSVDSIEISNDSKKMNLIKSKLESGFYDTPYILEKVAKKIISTISIEV